MPPDLDEAFRATDLTHLLAVSGGNLTVLLVLLIGPPHLAARAERRGLAGRLGVPLRLTALLGGALAIAFVVVCRPEPSVLRAAACGLVTLLAIGSGRRRSLLPALAAAVLLLVLYDPWLARSYGFLLSVLATGALLTLAPRWSEALRRRGLAPRVAEALAAAGAAQAVCAPVIVVLAARVSLVAIPCNLLAEPAVAPATVLGFAALATAPRRRAPRPVLRLAGRVARLLDGHRRPHRRGAAGSGARLARQLAGRAAAGPGRGGRRPRRPPAAAPPLDVRGVRAAPPARRRPPGPAHPHRHRLAAARLEDGGVRRRTGGDALVLAASPGSGTALVVDAGPEPRAVDHCLRELGVETVPLLVLTHYHADHVDGLPGVLRGRAVGAIETTPYAQPPGQAAFVRREAERARVPVVEAVPGERRHLGELSWEVLWPPPAGTSVAAEDGPNDASVTLLVRTGGLTLLLLGDLEPPAQQALSEAHPDLPPVDVLKVAHHGSAHQDARLLRALHPRLALISVGVGNPYGHPAARTVAALRAQGAVVLRTDTGGSLAVTGDGTAVTALAAGHRRTRRHRRRARSKGAGGGGRRTAARCRDHLGCGINEPWTQPSSTPTSAASTPRAPPVPMPRHCASCSSGICWPCRSRICRYTSERRSCSTAGRWSTRSCSASAADSASNSTAPSPSC
ncbi:hypothetical protein GCM10020000_55130 [Streptomyces olivoverticillatus]